MAAAGQDEVLERISAEQGLNDSLRAPLAMVSRHSLTLIEDPIGTGKTTLAIALLRLTVVLHEGPSLATAPRHTAADYIARLCELSYSFRAACR